MTLSREYRELLGTAGSSVGTLPPGEVHCSPLGMIVFIIAGMRLFKGSLPFYFGVKLSNLLTKFKSQNIKHNFTAFSFFCVGQVPCITVSAGRSSF